MKELKRYISTEEKDAHHCIQHYKKIRDRDGAQGQQLLPATISHLSLIRLAHLTVLINFLPLPSGYLEHLMKEMVSNYYGFFTKENIHLKKL